MKLISLTLIILILPILLSAWNSTGHMIVAAIAYDQLDSELQNTVRNVLKEHPMYQSWLLEMPDQFNEGAYLMMKSSLWPDQLRRSDDTFDHPEWHYVNFFINRETGFIDTTRESPDNDIIWGIAKSIEYIETGNPVDKAAYLSWLNHLVADIHAPLHCASVISTEYPEGDRGGNNHWVISGAEPIKLHFYWDMLPGKVANFEDLKNAVVRLTDNFPDTDFSLTKLTDHKEWALESLQIVYENVHLKLQLPVAYNPTDAHLLTAEYRLMAEEIYKQRIMLAAYRLKMLLETVLAGIPDE
jgi:hypothetical protein